MLQPEPLSTVPAQPHRSSMQHTCCYRGWGWGWAPCSVSQARTEMESAGVKQRLGGRGLWGRGRIESGEVRERAEAGESEGAEAEEE